MKLKVPAEDTGIVTAAGKPDVKSAGHLHFEEWISDTCLPGRRFQD